MIRGTVVAFDAPDGLGDVQLEDGRVVRFGRSALEGTLRQPAPGLTVLVFCLEVARPTDDGDFPVLYVPHDVLDGVRRVASSSRAWLRRAARKPSRRRGGAA